MWGHGASASWGPESGVYPDSVSGISLSTASEGGTWTRSGTKEDGEINSLLRELKDAGLKAAATRSKPACLGVLRGIGFSVAGRLRHAGLEGSCPAPTS